jgi:hypothetical protein
LLSASCEFVFILVFDGEKMLTPWKAYITSASWATSRTLRWPRTSVGRSWGFASFTRWTRLPRPSGATRWVLVFECGLYVG